MSRLGIMVVVVLGASGCAGDPVKDLDLDGQSLDEVVARYGPPDGEAELVVRKGELPYEYQSGMYTAVTRDLAEGDSVAVRELGWEGWRHRAVWATEQDGEWRVVDAIEWPRWVQF